MGREMNRPEWAVEPLGAGKVVLALTLTGAVVFGVGIAGRLLPGQTTAGGLTTLLIVAGLLIIAGIGVALVVGVIRLVRRTPANPMNAVPKDGQGDNVTTTPLGRLPSLPRVSLPSAVATAVALSAGELPAAFYTDTKQLPSIIVTNQRFLYRSDPPKRRARNAAHWLGWPLESITELKLLTRTKSGGLIVVALIPIPTPGSERHLIQVNGVEFDMGSEAVAKEAFQMVSRARLLRLVEVKRAARSAQAPHSPSVSPPPAVVPETHTPSAPGMSPLEGGKSLPSQTYADIYSAVPAISPTTALKYCPYCGTQTSPGHSFCVGCGKKLPA